MTVVFNSWQSVAPCASATKQSFAMEALPIKAANVVPPLSNVPFGDFFLLIVNGRTFTPVDPGGPFTIADNVITWASHTYSLNPGDGVVAGYTFLEPL